MASKKGTFFTTELVMSNNIPYIRFFGRWEDKSKMDFIVKGHRPYFYILEEEEELIDFECSTEKGFKSIYGDNIIKVLVDNPFHIKGWKDNPGLITKFSKTFEADISYQTRFLIDNQIYSGIEYDGVNIKPCDINVKPRIMNVDIETDYHGGSNADMSNPLTAIGFYDSYLKRIYCLTYHPDKKPEQVITKYTSDIIKDLDGNKAELEIVKIFVADEKSLLDLFKSFVVHFNVDIFTGWNEAFDIMYICKRMETLQMNPGELSPINKYYYSGNQPTGNDSIKSGKYGKREKSVMIRGRAVIDILKGFRRIKWKQVESFKLDSVAKSEFNIGKVDYEGWIGDFWKNNFDKFIEYNIRDIEMCEAINQKYSVIDSLLGIRDIAGSELADVPYNSKTLDTYILRYCKNKFVLPSKIYHAYNEDNESEDKVEGGFVLEPVVGLHKNVVVLDLKSLYPNIMLSYNMSPETVTENGELIVGNGIKFRKELGVLSSILITLGNERDKLRALLKTPEVFNNKDKYTNIYKRQYLFKTFTNSSYGVTLYSGFRLYNPNVGASITYVGRFLANKIRELAESKKYIVIRQDTDSAFVNVHATSKEDAIEKGKALEAEINTKFIDWFAGKNNDPSFFSIKFEKLYGLMFSGEEKKLYAGRVIWDWEKGNTDETEIKGFASVKTDRSQFSRNLQKTIFKNILYEDKSFNVLKYIYEEIDKFYNKEYNLDVIGIPKSITRDLEDYGIDNPWTRGVKWSMKNLTGFEFSPKPLLIYTKKTAKYDTDAICFNSFREVPNDIEIDYEKMLNACVYKIVEKQLIMMNVNPQSVLNYINNKTKNQMSLSDYLRKPIAKEVS